MVIVSQYALKTIVFKRSLTIPLNITLVNDLDEGTICAQIGLLIKAHDELYYDINLALPQQVDSNMKILKLI